MTRYQIAKRSAKDFSNIYVPNICPYPRSDVAYLRILFTEAQWVIAFNWHSRSHCSQRVLPKQTLWCLWKNDFVQFITLYSVFMINWIFNNIQIWICNNAIQGAADLYAIYFNHVCVLPYHILVTVCFTSWSFYML